MKNFLLTLLVSASIFISCKKDNGVYADPNSLVTSLNTATVTSSGKIIYADARHDDGMVKIYLRKDGVYVLGLEQMNYKSLNGTNVYLSSSPVRTTTAIKIFSAEKLYGNIYTPLSTAVNTAALKYLIIQDDAATDAVATASME